MAMIKSMMSHYIGHKNALNVRADKFTIATHTLGWTGRDINIIIIIILDIAHFTCARH